MLNPTGNGTFRIFGNMTMIINNANVYSISISAMELNGTIGKSAPNQIFFSQIIEALEIPANGVSRHKLPLDIVIPSTVDKAALASEVSTECIANLNKLNTVMSGKATVKALGIVVPFQFGPQTFQTRCL
jgi:hypothetical protein